MGFFSNPVATGGSFHDIGFGVDVGVDWKAGSFHHSGPVVANLNPVGVSVAGGGRDQGLPFSPGHVQSASSWYWNAEFQVAVTVRVVVSSVMVTVTIETEKEVVVVDV